MLGHGGMVGNRWPRRRLVCVEGRLKWRIVTGSGDDRGDGVHLIKLTEAVAAIPSSRPSQPRLSVVVALTDT